MPGNNGTAVGSPSFASTAQSFSNTNGAANFGNCVALNGSTQRIDLPVSTLQFALNASWTIRGRFRTTTSSGIQVIVSYGQTSGTPSDDIWIGVSSGVLQASVKNIGVLGTISVADGNWHTFEYSYTGGTKTGILFVDGVVSGANAAATAYPGSAGNANALSCIGAFAGGSAPAFYWNGQVDEVAVFDAALHSTASNFSEVTSPTSNTAANLRALYHMDGDATDSSSAGAPTSATLTGPSSGTTGAASGNFTITLDAAAAGTITFTPAGTVGTVTFTPSSPQITAGNSSVTFTANAASDGTHVISITNDGGLSNVGTVNYATSGSNIIPVTDSNWFFSPYNWDISGGAAVAVNGGAYFKLGFTGTAVAVAIDVSSLVSGGISAGNYPYIRYSVDGGAQTLLQLTSGTTALTISGLSAGTHKLMVEYDCGLWESAGTDRWTTPVYALKITGATIDSGASSSPPTLWTGRMIWFGDSISEGIRALNSATYPNNAAYESVPLILAPALDCEVGNVSFGGQGYVSGFGNVPAFNSAYNLHSAGRSRLSAGVLSPPPDYVCIWHGANGSPTSGNVQTAISNMRTIAPSAHIFVIVPVGGYNASAISTGYNSYAAANPADAKVHLINLGAAWTTGLSSFGAATEQGIDGLHPRSNWNARIAAAITQAMQEALGGAAVGGSSSGAVGAVNLSHGVGGYY